MIFKTFDSDIDKWTAKLGVFGKSFNELGTTVKTTVESIKNDSQTVGLGSSTKNNLTALFSSKKDYKRNSNGEIVTWENIDSYIPELSESKAKNELTKILESQN